MKWCGAEIKWWFSIAGNLLVSIIILLGFIAIFLYVFLPKPTEMTISRPLEWESRVDVTGEVRYPHMTVSCNQISIESMGKITVIYFGETVRYEGDLEVENSAKIFFDCVFSYWKKEVIQDEE